jgi:hexosaminidase
MMFGLVRRSGFVVLVATMAAIGCVVRGHGPAAPPSATSTDRELPLVPRPRLVTRCAGRLDVGTRARITVDDASTRAVGEQLARWLGLATDAVSIEWAATTRIELRLDAPVATSDPAVELPRDAAEESYRLDVGPTRAIVRARSIRGLFYGAQTLAELAGARRIGVDVAPLARGAHWTLPCVAIEDAPRFPVRAMHLDVARHFFGEETVRRYVDLLAYYRFNVFHWHLTDDQGFRIEVPHHPELTAVGGRDGFFTQAAARRIVEHARARAITVVPEIEMPGHARAILASHPELGCTGARFEVPRTWGVFDDVLCAGNEQTYALIDDVLREVMPIFPSRIVHVGGDEVPTTRWTACPKCRAAMEAARIGVADLEPMFMRRVGTMVERYGRRMAVWDEALTPASSPYRLPSSALVFAWQDKERGRAAASLGFDVVMAPHDHVYFNIHQSHVPGEPGHEGYLPWPKVRGFDPIPEGVDPELARHVLGGEGALWTEHVETPEQVDTMVAPRLAALADALWSGAGAATTFVARWNAQLPALDASRLRYFVDPPEGMRARHVFLDMAPAAWAPPPLFPSATVRFTTDGSDPSPTSPAFDAAAPLSIRESTTLSAALFLASGRTSPVVRSHLVKEQPRAARAVRSPRRGVSWSYFEGDFHRLPDFSRVTPIARGNAVTIGLDELERSLKAQGRTMRAERFAALFDGLVRVPADAVYRFVARADDGVRVEVDGQPVLEDDGEHEPRESDGEIALAAGHHDLRVLYFQGTEGKELEVHVERAGHLQPLDVVTEDYPH